MLGIHFILKFPLEIKHFDGDVSFTDTVCEFSYLHAYCNVGVTSIFSECVFYGFISVVFMS